MPQDLEFELEVEYPDPDASADENYRIMGVTMLDAAKLVQYLGSMGGQMFTWRYPNLRDEGEYEVIVSFSKHDPPDATDTWRDMLVNTLTQGFGAKEVQFIWTFREGRPPLSVLSDVIITFPVAEIEVRTRGQIQQEAPDEPMETGNEPVGASNEPVEH